MKRLIILGCVVLGFVLIPLSSFCEDEWGDGAPCKSCNTCPGGSNTCANDQCDPIGKAYTQGDYVTEPDGNANQSPNAEPTGIELRKDERTGQYTILSEEGEKITQPAKGQDVYISAQKGSEMGFTRATFVGNNPQDPNSYIYTGQTEGAFRRAVMANPDSFEDIRDINRNGKIDAADIPDYYHHTSLEGKYIYAVNKKGTDGDNPNTDAYLDANHPVKVLAPDGGTIVAQKDEWMKGVQANSTDGNTTLSERVKNVVDPAIETLKEDIKNTVIPTQEEALPGGSWTQCGQNGCSTCGGGSGKGSCPSCSGSSGKCSGGSCGGDKDSKKGGLLGDLKELTKNPLAMAGAGLLLGKLLSDSGSSSSDDSSNTVATTTPTDNSDDTSTDTTNENIQQMITNLNKISTELNTIDEALEDITSEDAKYGAYEERVAEINNTIDGVYDLFGFDVEDVDETTDLNTSLDQVQEKVYALIESLQSDDE